MAQGQDLTSFEAAFIDELMTSNFFKPELLNRFDEIVLFRPLNENELAQVVVLMVGEVNATLAHKNHNCRANSPGYRPGSQRRL